MSSPGANRKPEKRRGCLTRQSKGSVGGVGGIGEERYCLLHRANSDWAQKNTLSRMGNAIKRGLREKEAEEPFNRLESSEGGETNHIRKGEKDKTLAKKESIGLRMCFPRYTAGGGGESFAKN